MTTQSAPPGRPILATYLHLPNRDAFRPAFVEHPAILVLEAAHALVPFYRFLYSTVGSGFNWVDRLRWADERLHSHLSRPEVTLLVLYLDGTPAGYAELVQGSAEEGTEVAYFGIFPSFHGRGLGKHLLSVAVQRAFDDGATRVWLSTRTTDGPYAIANYEARGFRPFRTEWEPAPVHPDDDPS